MNIKECKPPIHTRRYVEWNEHGGRLIFLVGYCPDTLAYFAGLFSEAKTIDENVKEDEAICTKVIKSDSVQGFTLMIAPISGQKRYIEGFAEVKWENLRIQSF